MAPSEDGKLSVVDLSTLLADLAAIHGAAAEENGVRIILETPSTATSVLGDRGQLIQLFLNLLKNAVEAMPNGGIVTIRCTQMADTVTAQLVDEGVGFPSSLRANLFQPFFTTKPKGTGLGLSICKEIADFHRAALELVPRTDGGGTIAQVTFSSSLLESQNDVVGDIRSEPFPPRTHSPQRV